MGPDGVKYVEAGQRQFLDQGQGLRRPLDLADGHRPIRHEGGRGPRTSVTLTRGA